VNSGAAAFRRAAGAEEEQDPEAVDSGMSSCAMGIGEGKPRRPGVEGEKKRGDGTRAVSI